MRRLLRSGIAVGILLVLVLAGLPSAGSGGDGCCCGPSAKFCPMKQRGMGAVCAISRADACSLGAPGGEAPAPDERPYTIRAVLVDERSTDFPDPARQLFSPYVLLSAAFLAAPATPPPEGR
jgi:hypothetical protein